MHTPSGVRAWEFLSQARQAAVAEDTETPEQHAQRRLVGSLAVQGRAGMDSFRTAKSRQHFSFLFAEPA